jgi:hypothetical protein
VSWYSPSDISDSHHDPSKTHIEAGFRTLIVKTFFHGPGVRLPGEVEDGYIPLDICVGKYHWRDLCIGWYRYSLPPLHRSVSWGSGKREIGVLSKEQRRHPHPVFRFCLEPCIFGHDNVSSRDQIFRPNCKRMAGGVSNRRVDTVRDNLSFWS